MPATRQSSLNMKQGRLTFASSKRSASGASALSKSKNAKTATPIATPPLLRKRSEVLSSPDLISSDDESDDDNSGDYFDADVKRRESETSSVNEPVQEEQPPAKKRRVARTKVSTKAKPSPAQVRAAEAEAKARATLESDDETEPETLEVQDKKGRWTKHYALVREKMGNIEPVHSKDQTKVHHILRVFDLSYEYGPCVGVTRIQRWERANAMGLHPPSEVRDILLTKEAQAKDELAHDVFHGEV